MFVIHDAIFLVMGDSHSAKAAAVPLRKYLSGFTACSENRSGHIQPVSVDEMYDLLQNPHAPPLKPELQRAERRLFVAFDTAGSDFLDELYQALISSPKLVQRMQDSRLMIMSMSNLIYCYCLDHTYSKIWLQPPIPTYTCYDTKLSERLAQRDIELCQLPKQSETSANLHAVRAAFLDDEDALAEVGKFWDTLQPDLAQTGAQAALINNGMLQLVEQRSPDEQFPAMDINDFYLHGIWVWSRSNT